MFARTVALATLVVGLPALAAGVINLSNADADAGLRQALIQGANKAIAQLGAVDGFYENPEVKIPLPDALRKAERSLRLLGMGKQADALSLKMNRAAEAAVPEAKTLLVEAVRKMSIADARAILTGGDDAATQYFKKTTSAAMAEKFLPIVTQATQEVELAQQYNRFAKAASRFGLVHKEQANLEAYVTQKTLDGVYFMMAEEEKAIRKNPVAAGTSLIKKVFGAVAGQ